MQLKDKVVFVTGGTRGIGSACAKAVLERGAKVVITGTTQEDGLKQEELFKEEFGQDKVIFIQFDVSNENDFEAAFNEAKKEFGHIDVIINNAGDLDEVNWERMLDVNVKGVIHGTELANAHMRKDKGGRGGVIINISSLAGYTPFYVMPIYTASKHAVYGYTRSLASAPDVADQGIRYAVVCPNLVDTQLSSSLVLKGRPEYLDDVPGILSREMVTPRQVGLAVVMLLEDDERNDAVLEVNADGPVYRKLTVV